MFNFEEAMSHWETGPRISSIMDHGPWWYLETSPKDQDMNYVEIGEALLKIGYVKRETWFWNGELVTRYSVTKEGRAVMKRYRKQLDKKYAKIMKEIM